MDVGESSVAGSWFGLSLCECSSEGGALMARPRGPGLGGIWLFPDAEFRVDGVPASGPSEREARRELRDEVEESSVSWCAAMSRRMLHNPTVADG